MQPAAATGSAGADHPRRARLQRAGRRHAHRPRAAARRAGGLRLRGGLHPGQGVRLAHWLVNGAEGGRLFVRCFGGDGIVRENAGGDVLASLTTMVWNAPSKSWTGGATMEDASLNRRMTMRLTDPVAFAQVGIVGLDGQIELEALRLYGLP